MQTIEINKFLWSLMTAVEGRCGLVWFTASPTSVRPLWLNEIQDDRASDPSSVLRVYGGGSPGRIWGRQLTVSLQVMTRGKSSPDVLAQAWRMQEAMLDQEGEHPAVHWRITGKVLTLAAGAWSRTDDPAQDWEVSHLKPLQTPGIIGRDEQQRWLASVNYDCEFVRIGK